MGIRSSNRRAAVALALAQAGSAALLATPSAHAELDYGFTVGAGHSDNITRVDTAEVDETIAIAGVDVTWTERTRRLDAQAAVDLSYAEYLDNTYDGEVIGTADGTVVVGIAPERFTWLFQDSFGQTRSDPFAPVTPDSRENLNYFTTGPDVILRLGSASSLRLLGRYSAVQYEDSPLDSERTAGGIALGYRPSQRSEIALNGIVENVDFKDDFNTDYDRRMAFFSYRLQGARTELSAELGYIWLERDGIDDTEGGALVDISLQRRLSTSSTLRLTAGTRTTDASEALRGSLEGGGGRTAPDITATADPFENHHASLTWNFSRNRTALSLAAAWSEDEYETQTLLDRTRYEYTATFSRDMTRTLQFELLGLLTDEKFDNANFDADELQLGASLTWRPGRIIAYSLAFNRYDRDTSTGSGEFVENRVFLTVSVRPRGHVVPQTLPAGPARP